MGTPNNNPFNKIKCLDTTSAKSLIFNQSGINIIQGSKTLFNLPLADLFLPLTIYQYQEFPLAPLESIQLDPGNIVNANGEVTGLIIVADYPSLDTGGNPVDTNEKYINYNYPLEANTTSIGKIMIMTGTNKAGAGIDLISSPGGMTLTNPHANFSVNLRILVIS